MSGGGGKRVGPGKLEVAICDFKDSANGVRPYLGLGCN